MTEPAEEVMRCGGRAMAPFLLGTSCGPGLEEPQVRAVRLMVTAPPCKGVAAGGRAGAAGAALPEVAVEGLR